MFLVADPLVVACWWYGSSGRSIFLSDRSFLFLLIRRAFRLLSMLIIGFLRVVLYVLLRILEGAVLSDLLRLLLSFLARITGLGLNALHGLITLLGRLLATLADELESSRTCSFAIIL